MQDIITYLRDFNLVSVIVRLLLAAAAGGIIGYGRSKKQQKAGLRTYMLTGIGAALTVMISIYEWTMIQTRWALYYGTGNIKFDASRIAANVISGIGFLAAGTILASEHQQTSGLTTATGLFASVCMGICAGCGFYECVILSLIMLVLVLDVMVFWEIRFKRRTRICTLYVEFQDVDDVAVITDAINSRNATVYDIVIEHTQKRRGQLPGAIFSLRLSKDNPSHSAMLSTIAELDCVDSIMELIS